MFEKKRHLLLTYDEARLALTALVEMKNELIAEGRYTDCVDDLINKLVYAPIRKI